MKKIAFCLVAMVLLQSCSYFDRKDLKSPCVGIENSPCGPRHNVNDAWMS